MCADILEHLRHPEQVLRRIQNWLKPDGFLVVSIPNVRNHGLIRSLLAGNWTYESAGLLDQDHVRFFTRRELEKLLFRTGFSNAELRMVEGEGFDGWRKQGRPRDISVGGLQIRAASPEDAAEFFAYQYLACARPVIKKAWGLTSIILVVHNQLAYTQTCIDSIRMRTDEAYELIIIDNGSTDGTTESLKKWSDITVITNSTNRGFPAAVNQGLAKASGQNLLLLNNDTIVTTGWLHRMLDCLHSDSAVGLVGPVSNRVSGEQQIEVDYSDLTDLDGFAWDWGRAHGREFIETDRLVGFCLLIKRTVFEAVGEFDEQFGVGNFEDDDYCARALKAGFKAIVCRGAFVHHFGGTTFRAMGLDFAALLETNQRKFDAKHNKQIKSTVSDVAGQALPRPRSEVDRDQDAGLDRDRSNYLVAKESDNGLRLIPNQVHLSVCLIVRDNEGTIRPCLESIRPWVDEIVVVDTGSTDGTPIICEELGARVFHWAWRDDFSAARNVSFRHARGNWLFWMDSDDTISSECGQKLRDLADGIHDQNVFGYVVQVHCPGPGEDSDHDVTVVDHVKLIRNRPDLRFEGRIHEQIIPSIRRVGGDVQWTDIYVTHSGSDHSVTGRQRKIDRDLRILQQELLDQPEHTFVLFNLGMTYADAGQHLEAIGYLHRSIAAADPAESHLRKAIALLVSSCSHSNQFEAAWDACQAGLEIYPDDCELLFRAGLLHHHFGRLAAAEQSYLLAITERSERHFSSVDVGLATFKARHNLALVYEDMQEFDKAENEWRAIVREKPRYRPGYCGLLELLLRLGKRDAAQQVVENLIKNKFFPMDVLLTRARLAAQAGNLDVAFQLIDAAQHEFPNDLEPLRWSCRIAFESGHFEIAEKNLNLLTQRDPLDAAAFHNLATIYRQTERAGLAILAYQTSIQLRPEAAHTHLCLAEVLFECGNLSAAMAACEEALALVPACQDASQLLQNITRVERAGSLRTNPIPSRDRTDELHSAGTIEAQVTPTVDVQISDHASTTPGIHRNDWPSGISLCMIVRDNAQTLSACLESIRPWVDELIVVDTGSQDETPEIAARFGANIYHFPWCDDFSAARNESLKHARFSWILWMDSDDTISVVDGRKLRNLMLGPHRGEVLGYTVQLDFPRPGVSGRRELASAMQIRVVRNRRDLRFTRRVHEQLAPSIERAGGTVAQTDVIVAHSLADLSPEGRRTKYERNTRLLHLELADNPKDPVVLFELGLAHADASEHELAIDFLKKSLKLSSSTSSTPHTTYSLLVANLMRLGRSEEAWEICKNGRQLYPRDPELLFHEGRLAQDREDWDCAITAYSTVLELRELPGIVCLDRGVLGYKSHFNLASILTRQGNYSEAEQHLKQVVTEVPSFKDAWKHLADVLIRQNRIDEAKGLATQLCGRQELRSLGLNLMAHLARQLGDTANAALLIGTALQELPDDTETQIAWYRLAFEAGSVDQAETGFRNLLCREPQNIEARFDLGMVYLQSERENEAVEMFQKLTEQLPDFGVAYLRLGEAQLLAGQTDAARTSLRKAGNLEPSNETVKQLLHIIDNIDLSMIPQRECFKNLIPAKPYRSVQYSTSLIDH